MTDPSRFFNGRTRVHLILVAAVVDVGAVAVARPHEVRLTNVGKLEKRAQMLRRRCHDWLSDPRV
jgi:hypothetical protein